MAASEIYSFSPSSQVAFSITIPSTTFTSNSGPVYVQIRAPLTYQWVALGEVSKMAGSNMLIVYTLSADNITLSPRLATGHSMPTFNPDAQVSLLSGSGIVDGYMVANVRCDNCTSWKGGSLDLSSKSTNWIWAYKKGKPIYSSDMMENIAQHDSTGRQSVNMTAARLMSLNSSNPFTGYNATAAAVHSRTSTSSSTIAAHGYIMAAAFIVLFPLSALALHVLSYSKTVPLIHAPLQICTLALAVVGAGLGLYLGVNTNTMHDYHPIIGLVVVGALILFQPLMGIIQHIHFRRTGGRLFISYIHRWFGRIMIILGVVNGGLGLLLSKNMGDDAETGATVAYSVVAGIVGTIYIVILGLRFFSGDWNSKNKEGSDSGTYEQILLDNTHN